MTPLTLKDYLGSYDDPRITPEVRENAKLLIAIVNVVLATAELEGVEIQTNPKTGNHISGDGNGGVRPPDSPVGATRSAHKRGTAVDVFDPLPARALTSWCWRNKSRLELLGIRAMERAEYTPGWLHLSSEPVASGVFSFIPHSGPPIGDPLPDQTEIA